LEKRCAVLCLTKQIWTSTTADDGAKGLAMAKNEPPDLIISDLNMPELDGISMLRALRAHKTTQEIPVVILTSEENVETETQGLESGADDYILKPVEPAG
jgi:DNA-binding response OmpR family regulator